MSILSEHQGSLATRRIATTSLPEREFNKRKLNLVDGKIYVHEVCSKQDLDLFIKLPHYIYQDDPFWPGQEDEEVLAFFDPILNPSLKYISVKPLLAICNGEVVGRVCGCINQKYNNTWGSQVGFFGFFECLDNQEVANELFHVLEEWFLSNGKTELHGPVSLTYMDIVGVLVDGFSKTPMHALAYNPEYYLKLIENYGFSKFKDLYDMVVDTDTLYSRMDEKMHKVYPFIHDEFITARYFDRSNYERDSELVRKLFHDSFQSHLGFYALDDMEWKVFLDHYLDIVHEDLFVIVEDAGEPIAFAICFKDNNQLLHAKRYNKEGQINRQRLDLIGVKPDYIRGGIGTFLIYNLIAGLKANGTQELSISWVFEDNYNSIGLCTSLGLKYDKVYRICSKNI